LWKTSSHRVIRGSMADGVLDRAGAQTTDIANDPLFCRLCLVRCPHEDGLKQHLRGKKHKFQERLLKSTESLESRCKSQPAANEPPPSEQDVAAATRVLQYFGSNIKAVELQEYRHLRKAMTPVVEFFVARKWFGGNGPVFALAQAQVCSHPCNTCPPA